MGHHVMTDFLFPLPHALIIDILDMGSQFVHLFLRYRQAEFHLRLGQRHPQASPGPVARIGGEQLQHVFGSIPGGQWSLILLCHRFPSLNQSFSILCL